MIRGWANQFRHAASKKTFVYVDDCIFRALLKWIRRRHPDKNADWMRKKYFRRQGLRNWIFFARVQDKEGKTLLLDLFKAVRVPIKRHVKIKGAATPYDPAFRDYFERRHRLKRSPHLNTDVSEALPIF
jgi:RNA-directed DNA polymerase